MSVNQASDVSEASYENLSAFQRDILHVVMELAESTEESYGLAIKRRLEGRYEDDVNHGRLYPNLDDLVSLGLIERGEIDKRTNRYTITSEAKEEVKHHLEELEALFD
jgi:DNA-binding PadR family transcriptional regulator